MLAKPKQIVVDKVALMGINIDELCNFAKNHLMLGCDTLLYECATTSESRRKDMISRYKRIIKAGAYYCSCSITYIQKEAASSNPFPWFLPDLEYVLLLSRADGLLTRNEKLVKPLAQAAFPKKDVFSSLDEVPEEYVCHWS